MGIIWEFHSLKWILFTILQWDRLFIAHKKGHWSGSATPTRAIFMRLTFNESIEGSSMKIKDLKMECTTDLLPDLNQFRVIWMNEAHRNFLFTLSEMHDSFNNPNQNAQQLSETCFSLYEIKVYLLRSTIQSLFHFIYVHA